MAYIRGIRGAIRVDENNAEAIDKATRELLEKMVSANDVDTSDIASIFLTTTVDLDAEFPAYTARDMGWTMVPLLCAQELKVPHSMTRMLRILIHVNTEKPQNEIKHQYLGEAANLRPDLT